MFNPIEPVCSNCSEKLIPESNYCHMCGVAIPKAKVTVMLDRLCPSCGIALAANAEFCGNCGCGTQGSQTYAPTVRYLDADQIEQLYKDADNS